MPISLQKKVRPKTTSKILKDQKKQGKSKKWYNGNKWWQKEEGAKCHQKKKEKFKVEPEKYVD